MFFARPDDQVRVDFTDGPMAGTFISIRRRISDVDAKRLALGMFKGMSMRDGKMASMEADATLVDYHKLRLWVLKWGPADGQGTRPTTQELTTLLPEHAAQILAAINAHEESVGVEDTLASDPLLVASDPELTAMDDGLTNEPGDSGQDLYGPDA